MGIAAFVLALTYRSYRLTTAEDVANDPEDTRVSQLTDEEAAAVDEDRPHPDTARDTDEPDELDALPGHGGLAMSRLPARLDPAAGADPDDRRGDDAVRRPQAPAAAGHHADRADGGGRGVRGAAVPHRPRRHAGTARRRLGTERARHGSAGHHAGGGPAFGADAGGVVDRAAGGGVLRHRAGHPRRRRTPTGVDLPAHLPGAVGGRVQRVPGRRPVQPLRRLRGAAGGELRAADHRGEHRAGPRRASPM